MVKKLGWALAVGLVLAGIVVIWFWWAANSHPKSAVTINGTTFSTDLAKTPEELVKGLSWYQSLDSGSGLLMMFGTDGQHGIWMKDMRFAIDTVWIDKDYKVVYVVSDMQPASYPQVYRPDKNARYVLELAAGAAASSNIKAGDVATFDLR